MEEYRKIDSDDDGDLHLSLLIGYDLASSHFCLKVNRLLWYERIVNGKNICLTYSSSYNFP